MSPRFARYLTKLRESAFLEIKPGYEDSGAAPGKDTAWVNPARPQAGDDQEGRASQGEPQEAHAGDHPHSGHLGLARPARLPRARPGSCAGMKSPYVSELEPNQPVTGTFLVSHKEVRQKKERRAVPVPDAFGPHRRSGREDVGQRRRGRWTAFERDNFVRVKGLLQVFQNRPQLTIHKLQPVAGFRDGRRATISRSPNATATKCSGSWKAASRG